MKKAIIIIIGIVCLSLNAAMAHVSPLKDHKLAAVSRFTEYFKYHGLPLGELIPFINSLQEINSNGIDSQEIADIIARINNTILQNTSISIGNEIHYDIFDGNKVNYLTYRFDSKKRKIYFLTKGQDRITNIRTALGIAEKDLHLLQVPAVTNVWIANPKIDLTRIINLLLAGWIEYETIKKGYVQFVIDPIEKKVSAIVTDEHTGRKTIAKQNDLSDTDIDEFVDVLGKRKIVLDQTVSKTDRSWPEIGARRLPPELKPGQFFLNDPITTVYVGEGILQRVYPPYRIEEEEKWASYAKHAKAIFDLEKAIDDEVSTFKRTKGIIKLDARCLGEIDREVGESLRKYLLKIDQENMVALELTRNGQEPIDDIEDALGKISYPALLDVIRRLVNKTEKEGFRDLVRSEDNTIALMYQKEESPQIDNTTVIYLEKGKNPQLIHGMSIARYIISLGGPQSIEDSPLTLIRNAYKAMLGTDYSGKPIDEMGIVEILQSIKLPVITTPDLRTIDILYHGLLALDTAA